METTLNKLKEKKDLEDSRLLFQNVEKHFWEVDGVVLLNHGFAKSVSRAHAIVYVQFTHPLYCYTLLYACV